MKSAILTIVQFASLGYLLLSNPWLSGYPLLAALQFSGLVLGVWAIYSMSKSKLNVTPAPRKGATLVGTGPYRLIRHPMYTSLFLMITPVLFDYHDVINMVVFTIFLVNMILKLNYEEILLRKKFPAYAEMEKRTWRLIPWVY